MTRKINLPVVTALLVAVAGATIGVKKSIDYFLQEKTPAIAAYEMLGSKFAAAANDWNRIPESERVNYRTQEHRSDYSVSQARSRAEQTYQRLQLARAALDESVNQPEVRRHENAGKLAFGGILMLFGGLAFASRLSIRRLETTQSA